MWVHIGCTYLVLGVVESLVLSPQGHRGIEVDKHATTPVELFKFMNKRSGLYLVAGLHSASCNAQGISGLAAHCPLDASDEGFLWSFGSDGRITNKKTGESLYTRSGDRKARLAEYESGAVGFGWSITGDKRIKNLQFDTYLCASSWGENTRDTNVVALAWTEENQKDYDPLSGFEWEPMSETNCDPNGLVGKWENTTFETEQRVTLGVGNPAHTISARIFWPDVEPTLRSWILNVGQSGKGAHHWLWNPTGHRYGPVTQIGVWSGGQGTQYQQALPTTSIRLTVTADGNSIKIYEDGTLKGTLVGGAKFDFSSADQVVDVGKDDYGSGADDIGFPGGLVEGLCIWNRELSATEISSMSSQ